MLLARWSAETCPIRRDTMKRRVAQLVNGGTRHSAGATADAPSVDETGSVGGQHEAKGSTRNSRATGLAKRPRRQRSNSGRPTRD